MIKISNNQFHRNKDWDKPLDWDIPTQDQQWVELFDQNGYRLTELELLYAEANNHPVVNHRREVCLRQDWLTSDERQTGPHLNHSFLFERKGYGGEALEQLKKYAKENNLIHKLINYKGKWGVDLSVDYVDEKGNSMELLHFEYDSHNYNEIQEVKKKVEVVVSLVDWDWAAKLILEKKDEWIDLEFFDQSKWKTDFFNLPAERFKVLSWD